jgi:hypothetical protein
MPSSRAALGGAGVRRSRLVVRRRELAVEVDGGVINARCVKACRRVPRISPVAPICSE